MVILEKEKYPQIDGQRPRQNQPLFLNVPPFHQKPGSPGNDYRNYNQPQIGGIPVTIEKKGSGKQENLGKDIAEGFVTQGYAHSQKEIHYRDKRKKQEKSQRIENHIKSS